MISYHTARLVIERDVRAEEEERQIAAPCRTRLLLQAQEAPVCLFFHGFTAGTYQFEPMGQSLFQAGYNVVVPCLPGHGQIDDWQADNPPPLPENPRDYLKFAVKWLRLAQKLGPQVSIGGISGGGTISAWLAIEQVEHIHRAVLFAPYFSGSNPVIDLFVEVFDTYFEWQNQAGPSYPGFDVAALRAIFQIGDYVLKRVKQSPMAPVFTISSESDRAVNNRDHQRFFEAELKYQPRCWYHRFGRVLDIPHTMMTEAEGNRYAHLLIIMTRAYLESDLTWAEIEEIGYRMTRGRTFNAVVAELGWQDRSSANMPAMMTLVDKRAIVEKRQTRNRERSRHARLYDR